MMQVKDNQNYVLRKTEGEDGYDLCHRDKFGIKVIGKLDNNFQGETDDAYVKYDTKKDILLFESKIKYHCNYNVNEYDTMPEEDYTKHRGNSVYAKAGNSYIDRALPF